ncbi:MAG: hypothetical protein Q7T82_02815 [Armatimonadota bacterium]|nr:hypothetical protein [Armatimonadota bacterium]
MAVEDHRKLARRRFERLKRAHFRLEGRDERIANALKALEEATENYPLDAETVRWIAEDKDIEDA